MRDGDIVTHLARFAGRLRERGVGVGLDDEVDGARALLLVDLADRAEVYRALRTALKIRRRDWGIFDELFRALWLGGSGRRAAPRTPVAFDHRGPPRWSWDGRRVRLDHPGARGRSPEGEVPGYSPEAVLRRKRFDECTPRDLTALEPTLRRLARKVATRRSRRLVPSRARGLPDLRRSFRRAVAADGELLRLARRSRAVEQPQLVVLCDTSGSMDPHSRFLVAFALALKQIARRTEIFAFNTSLTRVTPWLAPRKIGPTLDRLAAGVPDWSGGTKIGATLAEFVARYQNAMVTSKTVVVILSDGLDLGESDVLRDAMRAIRRRAAKVIWLNPLLGDPRYRPTARGMAAALPYVDHFAPAHNVESLERLLTMVAV